QPYEGSATTDCSNKGNSVLGYSCNGLSRSCQAYLIFRSQPPYTTVASISTLLNADPSQVSAINEVSDTAAALETNKLVIVPVNCSCSGEYYQANASYPVKPNDNLFLIANDTYQGLSTCQALQNQSTRVSQDIFPGERITVPLRCACPTKNQSDAGIRYLLSYVVTWGDTVSAISVRFGADVGTTLEANSIGERSTINPFTTILVPLQNPPSSSQTIAPPPPPPSSSPPPPSSPSPGKNSSKTWIYVVAGVVGGIALTIVCGAIVFFACFGKAGRQPDPVIASKSFEAQEKPLYQKADEESQDFLESVSSIAKSVKVYKFEELQAATDDFSASCWIRGSVYRGVINGDFAAIKKMNGDVSKEINLLTSVSHSNVIRLSGVCFNDGNWYLVYEFAANGPLSDWIYNMNNEGKFLNWTQRIQIAVDVVTGLNYLHSFTNNPHVHKDIKSSNILLDGDFRAKIANFALARSAEGLSGEFALTRHIVGTRGYMAPEYLENGLVSTKLDVYACGVLMLEMVTGKEVAAFYTEENINLSDVLSDVLSEEDGHENLRQFMDPSLQGNYPQELAVFVLRLVDSCLSKNPADRPAVDEISAQFLMSMFTSSSSYLQVVLVKSCIPMERFIHSFLILLFLATSNIHAQQSYSGNSVLDCNQTDANGPNPAFLYTCNGKRSCLSFLIYKSQPSYNTVSRISNLISSDPSEVARINNILSSTVVPTDQELLVPVICSCSGKYYQANTSYVIPSIYDTYFTIANDTYEGLSSCNTLISENSYSEFGLHVGMELHVPLRCACPTDNQTREGTEFLLTYLVSWGDKVPNISKRFNASIKSVAFANGFAEDDPILFPFTTILVPLKTEPSSSQTIIQTYPSPPAKSSSNTTIQTPKPAFPSRVWIIVGIPLLVLFVVLSLTILIKKTHFGCQKDREAKKKSVLPDDFFDKVARVDQGLKIYTFDELVVATEDFGTENKLSDSVCRGVIGGQLVAIKKMRKDVSNEVNLLRKINHFNLISLNAACKHQGGYYLVYEFMENGCLRDWIHKQTFCEFQSWSQRVQIALDVANGLHYIHNFADPPYVHKDISSSNILLSRHFRAKIANFSVACLAEAEEYVNSSMRLAMGAKGYLAPEYIESGLVTPKIDIYAFGVVLLELITGKEPVFMQNGREVQLSEAIISIIDIEAEIDCLVDPNLLSKHRREFVLRMVKLSLACLAQEPESRPTMEEIVSLLSKIQLDIWRSESMFKNRFTV
ncbi:hypothetical protein Tsubulata_004364, partial [Turnera subulata]